MMAGWRRTPSPTVGRWWALDLETTGLDPARARVLAVGMVPIVDGVIRLGEALATRVHPVRQDLAVHGIEAHHLRPRDVADAPALADVLPDVLARLGVADGLLVHHAPLDVAVLRRASAAVGATFPDVRVLDTLDLVRRANRRREAIGAPVLPTDLAGARAALGLPPHHAHDALADAVATAELALALAAVRGTT